MKFDAPFSFVVFLGMLHYLLWGMPVSGRTVTRNLKFVAQYSNIGRLLALNGSTTRVATL